MIIKAFKDKIFPLKNPANYPDYVSEKDTLTSSSELSRNSSPKGAIAASPRSSPDLPRSSPDLPRRSSDSSRSSSPISNENIEPKIISHYFAFNSLSKDL